MSKTIKRYQMNFSSFEKKATDLLFISGAFSIFDFQVERRNGG